MIVLSIDPGSVTAGYALLQKEGRKITYLASGILKFDGQVEFLHRVKDIHEQTAKLLDQFQPDEIALEALIYVKSPTALMKLAQSRGIMLGVLGQRYHQKIFEYSPNLVKATVTGHGHSDKEGIQKILKQYLGVSEFKTHDESDALAVALCHILHHGQSSILLQESRKKKKSGSLSSSLSHKIKEQTL